MLEIDSIWKSYPGPTTTEPAMKNINYTISQGEFFTLLGPSGCGKSTTLRCIAGLETPDAGEMRLDGEIIYSKQRRTVVPTNKRSIMMVFQSYAIWPHMTVFDNIAFPLQIRHIPANEVRHKVLDALEMVGLRGLEQRSATQLSGGQQQRVALARAIITKSKLLLLDEPLSNLDAKLRVQMRTELHNLQRRLGITTMYVTHDQEEALSLADRVAVMYKGEIVEIGKPQEIYLRPMHPFTAEFVGQANVLPGEVVQQQNGYLTVRTPLGVLEASPSLTDVEGAVRVMIRPEHIQLYQEEAGTSALSNMFEGLIERTTFLGKLVEYEVGVNQQRLLIQTISTSILPEGTRVRLHLPSAHCLALS